MDPLKVYTGSGANDRRARAKTTTGWNARNGSRFSSPSSFTTTMGALQDYKRSSAQPLTQNFSGSICCPWARFVSLSSPVLSSTLWFWWKKNDTFLIWHQQDRQKIRLLYPPTAPPQYTWIINYGATRWPRPAFSISRLSLPNRLIVKKWQQNASFFFALEGRQWWCRRDRSVLMNSRRFVSSPNHNNGIITLGGGRNVVGF